MSVRYLLDTNAVIALMRGNEELVRLFAETLESGGDFEYSVITQAEIAAGLHKYTDKSAILRFLGAVSFIEVTQDIARKTGDFRSRRLGAGYKNPKLPDALIMITAAEHGYTLVSNDTGMACVEELGGQLRRFED